VAAVRAVATDGPARAGNARRAFEAAYCDTATLPQLDAVIDR
jgi:hypothetical protein